MCESMCVGSLRMTFVPVEAPKVVPKQRITPRIGLFSFQPGDMVFNCERDGASMFHKDARMVVRQADKNYYIRNEGGRKGILSEGDSCPYVLESETIIENGVRVVGYVNDPCPQVVTPKTLKFNDLPNWCVFTSNKVFDDTDRMEFIKINHNTVVYSYDNWKKDFRYVDTFPRCGDESWGIYNNLADCTIIGNIKFG